MVKPRIHIIMATYNGESYLAEQIQSIIEQSYDNWILTIFDDASADETLEVAKEYAKNDKRISVKQRCVGTGSAKYNFMSALKKCDDDYVMFSDQDDVWLKNKIEFTLKLMQSEEAKINNTPVVVCTNLEVVDNNLNTISPSFQEFSQTDPAANGLNNMLVDNIATGCTMMINRCALEVFKMTSSDSNIIMHDWWLGLIGACFGRLVCSSEITIKYRQHSSNSAGAVKHSVMKKAFKLKDSYALFESTIKQASSFGRSFKGLMTEEQHCLVENYSRIKELSPFKRINFIKKNGLIKRRVSSRFMQYMFLLCTQ